MKLFRISLIIIYVLACFSVLYNFNVLYNTGKIDPFYIYMYGSIFLMEAIKLSIKNINQLLETVK